MNRIRKSLAVTLTSAIGATLFATGLLTAVVAVVAAAQGDDLLELYARYVPTHRGLQPSAALPFGFYIIFAAYVIVAAEAAILIRRRLRD